MVILSTHEVPSDSTPGKTYTVNVYSTHATCTCPAWQRQGRPNEERVCKHVEQVTGELRKGDGRLTSAEAAWVVWRLASVTSQPFSDLADAVEAELRSQDISSYERELGAHVIALLRGARDGGDPPGPDARQALALVLRAATRHGES